MTLTIIITIIIIKKDWQCMAGRGRLTPYQSEDPNPTLPTYRKRRERENSWRQKRREQLGQQKGIGPALEIRQSDTIEYRVNQIIPERYWEGNKSPAVLRGSAAGRRISIPMCDQSTASNPGWHIRHKVERRVTPDLVRHTQHYHRSTMGKITVKHDTS